MPTQPTGLMIAEEPAARADMLQPRLPLGMRQQVGPPWGENQQGRCDQGKHAGPRLNLCNARSGKP
jgi:hypothetical protein